MSATPCFNAIGLNLFFQGSWALLVVCVFMLQLIDCEASFFCLLCFPLYTICWRFFILSKKEQMKSKLSPWACEIVCLYNLPSQSFLIFYGAFNLWQVYALKLMYQWEETRKQCLGDCQVRTVVEITHFPESNHSSSESSQGLYEKQTSLFPSTALENSQALWRSWFGVGRGMVSLCVPGWAWTHAILA